MVRTGSRGAGVNLSLVHSPVNGEIPQGPQDRTTRDQSAASSGIHPTRLPHTIKSTLGTAQRWISRRARGCTPAGEAVRLTGRLRLRMREYGIPLPRFLLLTVEDQVVVNFDVLARRLTSAINNPTLEHV